MKKALVMLLAVVLVIGMAVPAYAVSSPVGDKISSTATADLPKLTDESKGYVELVATEDAEKLTKESQAITELVVKQYLDGKWVELKSAINADGTVSIYGLVEGPVAIFTK